MNCHLFTRRHLIQGGGLAAIGLSPAVRSLLEAADRDSQRSPFKIGALDASIQQRQRLEAFAVAKEIGLDGVEVSFGQPNEQNDLRDSKVRQRYLAAARAHELEIASLAMGVLNQVPYATDPRTEQWVVDAVETMAALKVKTCLVAFFNNGDINGDRAKQDEVIRRLKRVAPKAEQAGVVLGVESWLNADDHIRIVDSVASPAVKVYYDVANMHKQGYDLYQDIRRLGRDRICQFHAKENSHLLGQGEIDFRRVKEAIDDIGYTGWLIIEGATVKGKSLVECYQHNQKFLRSVFPTATR